VTVHNNYVYLTNGIYRRLKQYMFATVYLTCRC